MTGKRTKCHVVQHQPKVLIADESSGLPFLIMTIIHRPYIRGFFCSDESIQYPVKPDTISNTLLSLSSIGITAVIFCLGEAYMVYTKGLLSKTDFSHYLSAVYKLVGIFLYGVAVTQSLTALSKYVIGRLRPHFLAVCDIDLSQVNCSLYVMAEDMCRGKPSQVREARLSFYSSHASLSMFCMVFLALYIEARLKSTWAQTMRPALQFFVIFFALYVGYTRISDYKHHASDVLTGFLQGALLAILIVSPMT
ncbi:phospholipid phosphatase 2-like [Polypterus senegalus]|uniref:phospholipid phosphatase 2-like n=1 Tax=Polypterus senegalus TaxID=55291 RepID=UPI0019645FAF|nr:phospholipid phosphatase 2-like [Polypterus senegalus]